MFPLAQCGPVGSGPASRTLQASGLLVLVYAGPGSYLPGQPAFFRPGLRLTLTEGVVARDVPGSKPRLTYTVPSPKCAELFRTHTLPRVGVTSVTLRKRYVTCDTYARVYVRAREASAGNGTGSTVRTKPRSYSYHGSKRLGVNSPVKVGRT